MLIYIQGKFHVSMVNFIHVFSNFFFLFIPAFLETTGNFVLLNAPTIDSLFHWKRYCCSNRKLNLNIYRSVHRQIIKKK